LSHFVKGTFIDGVLAVGDLAVWSNSAVDDFPTGRAKAFPLMTIVLKAKSLDYFAAGVDYAREVSFMSHPAILIETNRLSWALLVTA
jgi:hypothetical protein